MGIPPASVTVRYRNVSVLTSLVVGDKGLPTLTRTITGKLQVRCCAACRAPVLCQFSTYLGVEARACQW